MTKLRLSYRSRSVLSQETLRDFQVSVRLNWIACGSASCCYAVARLARGDKPVAAEIVAALGEPTADLRRFLAERHVAAEPFFANLVPASVTIVANRELAQTTLTKTVGRGRADALVELTAGLLTACEQAYFRAFPQLLDELELRSRPLRELWEASGPGLLVGVGRRTDPRLLLDEATVAVVQPFAGGGGGSYAPYNSVAIEAVLANPHPQLPETVRLAWLLSTLNADLPEFVELLSPGTALPVMQLAMLPAVLEAAADVEQVRPGDGLLAAAAEAWGAPRPAGDQTFEVVEKWWAFSRLNRAPWNVALTALEHLLLERKA
jgi:hypothetical protein